MNKTLKTIITVCCIVALVAGGALVGLAISNRHACAVVAQSDMLFPTVDFVQGWLARRYSSSDWDAYFKILANAGFDSVILQSTVNVGEHNFLFFDDGGVFGSNFIRRFSNTLELMLSAADDNDFCVYVGTVNDSDWWDQRNYADADFCQTLADRHAMLFKTISQRYAHHKSFAGWYYTPEMYTNAMDYEKNWIPLLNKVIDSLNATTTANLPLIISPYYSNWASRSMHDTTTFKQILTKVHFRANDIFAPQDGFGNESPTETDNLARLLDYEQSCFEAAQQANVTMWINVELFFSDEYTVASMERIQSQLRMANMFCDKVACFSFSHYFSPMGTNRHDTTEHLYNQYLNLRDMQ